MGMCLYVCAHIPGWRRRRDVRWCDRVPWQRRLPESENYSRYYTSTDILVVQLVITSRYCLKSLLKSPILLLVKPWMTKYQQCSLCKWKKSFTPKLHFSAVKINISSKTNSCNALRSTHERRRTWLIYIKLLSGSFKHTRSKSWWHTHIRTHLVLFVVHAKVGAGMLDKHVILSESSSIQQQVHTFPGWQLTLYNVTHVWNYQRIDVRRLILRQILFESRYPYLEIFNRFTMF